MLWLCSFINDSSPFVTAAESFDESLSFRKSSRLIILRGGTQLFCKASSCPLWIIAIIISMKWILAFQNGVGGGVPLRGNVYSSVVGLFCVPLWWKCTLADINLVYINVCRLLQVHLLSVSIVRRQINSHTRHQWSTFYREYKQYICVTYAVMGPYLLMFPMWSHVSGWAGHFASLSGGFNVTPMVMCLVLWQRGDVWGTQSLTESSICSLLTEQGPAFSATWAPARPAATSQGGGRPASAIAAIWFILGPETTNEYRQLFHSQKTHLHPCMGVCLIGEQEHD